MKALKHPVLRSFLIALVITLALWINEQNAIGWKWERMNVDDNPIVYLPFWNYLTFFFLWIFLGVLELGYWFLTSRRTRNSLLKEKSKKKREV